MSTGTGQSSAFGLETHGFRNLKAVNWNLTAPALYEQAIARGEGHVAKNGPLVVLTGQHTGRSATDKFVVRDAASEDQIWWDNNKSMTPAHFDVLYADMMAFAQGRELFAKDLFGGADLTHRVPVRIVTEYAWHSLFVHQLLIRPTADQIKDFPGIHDHRSSELRSRSSKHGTASETVIAVNFTKKMVLIGGTSYAGEMKKSVFTILNYLLPPKRVMPMHCSANVGQGSARRRSSLAFRAPARRHCRRTPRAPWWATTNMAGASTASSISKAAAMPRSSGCPGKPSRRSLRRRNASAPCSKTW